MHPHPESASDPSQNTSLRASAHTGVAIPSVPGNGLISLCDQYIILVGIQFGKLEFVEVFYMFGITVDDVLEVYEQLKDRYDLVLTTTSALDEGFTVDCPIIVGKAHGQIIELYEDGGDFILDVMDAEQTKGTHWHPNDIEGAVDYIVEFMEGKSDYEVYPFGKV